jgi:AcrR family transcriptional regulator
LLEARDRNARAIRDVGHKGQRVSPRPSLAAKRKPQILTAAARVIAARGLDGTRLSDVADAAGVSIGSVQHYFHTRERLLLEAYVFETERAVDRWLGAGADERDAWERLLAVIDAVLNRRTFRERWTCWLEFWARAARDPALRSDMGELYVHWRAPFRRAVEAGIDSGRFRPLMRVDVLVDRAVALFDGLALQVLMEAPGMSLDRMRELIVESLATDLRPVGYSDQKAERKPRAASIPSRPRAVSSGT